MKIAIATTGRFHVLDLARELAALGHEVAFYSILPHRRAMRFGLPSGSHRGLLRWLFPLVALQRYGGKRLRQWADPLMLDLADRLIARKLETCDVFIGMSGLCVESARAAQQRFGAKIFIERGSRHIRSQQAILAALADRDLAADRVPDYAVQRELQGYAIADRIVVPSRQAEQSFIEEGVPEWQLFRNPYGVELSMFPATEAPQGLSPTLLFVGAWTYQKGVDLLVAAWRELVGVRLVHIGTIGDAPMPTDPGFEHHDPVPQWQLPRFYQRAHAFVIASRQEGLALVQAQALASGLPIVCTDRTGGGDLREMVADPKWISVVPHEDAIELAGAIREMLPRAMALSGMRDLLGNVREKLSWAAYGKRYAEELEHVCADGKGI